MKRLAFALLLVGARAGADASAPAATETIDGIVVDLATGREVGKQTGAHRCSMMDSPLRQIDAHDGDARGRRVAGPGLYLADETPHHLLYSTWWDKPSRLRVLDRASLRVVLDLPEPNGALVERGDGTLAGVVAIDRDSGALRFYDGKGRQRWRRAMPKLWFDSGSALLDGDAVIVARFGRIATGSYLAAFDLATGAPRWTADVEQMNVGHSKYWNDVRLGLRSGRVVMRGYEAAGCYLQIFDAQTGQRRYAHLEKQW